MLRREILRAGLTIATIAAIAVGCAADRATSAAGPGATPPTTPDTRAPHPAAWYTLAAGRADFQKSEHDFTLAATDCTIACKALASLERAADHLCVVAEPDECTDARARVDRARRAVQSQCGGC